MTTATAPAPEIAPAMAAPTGLSFGIDRDTLAQHIGIVAHAVPSRPNQPVLANLLFTVSEEGLVEITAYDLTIGIRSGFAATVERPGSTTIPAKLLTDIVGRLSGELHITENDGQIKIKSGSGKYDIRCLDADEFPALASIKEETGSISLKTASLLAGLRGTMFCVSADETKQILTGVRVEIGGGKSTMAATDGHRLAVVEESEIPGELQATIPLKALRDLQRMLGAFPSDEIELTYDNWGATFRWGGQTLVSRILDGQYPNYRQLMPQSFESEAICDRRDFLNAVERIHIIADQKNRVIKIELKHDNQSLIMSAEAQDVGSGSEQMACAVQGAGQVIAFNSSYLMEGLKQISTQEVVIRFNSPTSPVVIQPVNGEDSTYLVMPVQVRQ
jgi:DNA polymerase-3 subunit beta